MERGSTLGRKCTVDGCERKRYGLGLCVMHYSRLTRTGTVEKQSHAMPPEPRFMAKVNKLPNGCWEWTGTITHRGYAMFCPGPDGPKMVSAHRWSYMNFVGPIPDGQQVGHTCHDQSQCDGGDDCPHRRCVNPEHLAPMTNAENVLAGNRARGVMPTELSVRQMERRAARKTGGT